MTLTAIVGALVALLPRPERPVQIPVVDEVARLTEENKQLRRSRSQLFDHIQMLEREILTEQHLCTHWRETAQRLAKQSREDREAAEKARDALADYTRRDLRLSQEALALYQQQQNFGLLQAQGAQQQMQAAQNAQLAQYAGLQNAFGGFCNCVPGRSQVFLAEQRGLRWQEGEG